MRRVMLSAISTWASPDSSASAISSTGIAVPLPQDGGRWAAVSVHAHYRHFSVQVVWRQYVVRVEIWRCLARPESGGGDSSIRNHGSWWPLRARSGEWRGEKTATDTSAWVVSCNTSRRGHTGGTIQFPS